MPLLTHITSAHHAPAIRRSGLTLPRCRYPETDTYKHGIFALPVIDNFLLSHQWLRELKRRGFRVAVGVYFRVPDQEQVWAGRYNQPKTLLTAAEAAAWLRRDQLLGFEVIIPRAIAAADITAIRALPQTLGWRYYPGAHGVPVCGCPYCQRGNYNSRRLRERYESQS